MFTFEETKLKGAYIITPKIFKDSRGYFTETYKKEDFLSVGIKDDFVQDNESYSHKGVLRGLHFQTRHIQSKLVRVINGEIYDVIVDLRPDSNTYGHWIGINLSSENKKMLYVPKGFAHGFLVLSDEVTFVYKCGDIYDHEHEGGIIWNDEDLNIDWPKLDVDYIISDKDKVRMNFRNQSFNWALELYH